MCVCVCLTAFVFILDSIKGFDFSKRLPGLCFLVRK